MSVRPQIRGPFAPVILGSCATCSDCGQPSSRRRPTREGHGPDWPHCKSCWAPDPGIELMLYGTNDKRWVVRAKDQAEALNLQLAGYVAAFYGPAREEAEEELEEF